MEDQIVSFEVAKLAKEKGFDELVTHWYSRKGVLNVSMWDGEPDVIVLGKHKHSLSITAPTQSLLQRWLREEHNLLVQMYTWKDHASDNNDEMMWKSEIKNSVFISLTYEESLEAGLLEALKTLSKKKSNKDLKPSGWGIIVDKSKATKSYPMRGTHFPKEYYD